MLNKPGYIDEEQNYLLNSLLTLQFMNYVVLQMNVR